MTESDFFCVIAHPPHLLISECVWLYLSECVCSNIGLSVYKSLSLLKTMAEYVSLAECLYVIVCVFLSASLKLVGGSSTPSLRLREGPLPQVLRVLHVPCYAPFRLCA